MARYKPRSAIYKLDYVSYWNNKGEYGKIRASRMRDRKSRRFIKWYTKKQERHRRYGQGYCPCCGRGSSDYYDY